MGTQQKITVKEKPGKKNEFLIDNRYTVYTKSVAFKKRFASGVLTVGMCRGVDPRDTFTYVQIEADQDTIIECGYSRPNHRSRSYMISRGEQESEMLQEMLDLASAQIKELREKLSDTPPANNQRHLQTDSPQQDREPKKQTVSPYITSDRRTLLCPQCLRPLEIRDTGYGPIYGCTGFRDKNDKCDYFIDKPKADKLDRKTLEIARPADSFPSNR